MDEAGVGEVALGAVEAVGVAEVAVEVADLGEAEEAEAAMEAAGNGPIIIFKYLELKQTSLHFFLNKIAATNNPPPCIMQPRKEL